MLDISLYFLVSNPYPLSNYRMHLYIVNPCFSLNDEHPIDQSCMDIYSEFKSKTYNRNDPDKRAYIIYYHALYTYRIIINHGD